jgi:hypothetical protein
MLETIPSDLSFRLLLKEGSRRHDEILDEFRERIAGFLAIALVMAVPLYWTMSGSELSLVGASEAAESSSGPAAFEPPPVNSDAVLNRLEANQLSRADLRAIQARLKRAGFDPGPIDGIAGRQTLAALNAYRQSVNLAPAQAVSRATIAGLRNQ